MKLRAPVTSGEAETESHTGSSLERDEWNNRTMADGITRGDINHLSQGYEPKPLFVLTEVENSKHNESLDAYACASVSIYSMNFLPAISGISKVLFDLQACSKSVQDGDRASSLREAHNKPIGRRTEGGGGPFLREHSQETPSPLLSFLLLSLAAPACSLLSFLISTAGAACTPSRHNSSFSCVFQGRSPHITSQSV